MTKKGRTPIRSKKDSKWITCIHFVSCQTLTEKHNGHDKAQEFINTVLSSGISTKRVQGGRNIYPSASVAYIELYEEKGAVNG